MLERLITFLQDLAQGRTESNAEADDPVLVVAALSMQVMEADGVVSPEEISRLRQLLSQHYNLSAAKVEKLIEAGQTAGREAVDYHVFTSRLKQVLDHEACKRVLGLLWDIVYADGVRSEMEDHVIWRIADLLDISDRERVELRMDAAARAPQPPGAS